MATWFGWVAAAAPRWCSCWRTPRRRPAGPPSDRHTTSAVGDLRQVAALLEGLRALGSGRVLDEVLALVMDSALEVTGAERGFIMLANAGSELEFKIARGRGRADAVGQAVRDQPQDP